MVKCLVVRQGLSSFHFLRTFPCGTQVIVLQIVRNLSNSFREEFELGLFYVLMELVRGHLQDGNLKPFSCEISRSFACFCPYGSFFELHIYTFET